MKKETDDKEEVYKTVQKNKTRYQRGGREVKCFKDPHNLCEVNYTGFSGPTMHLSCCDLGKVIQALYNNFCKLFLLWGSENLNVVNVVCSIFTSKSFWSTIRW